MLRRAVSRLIVVALSGLLAATGVRCGGGRVHRAGQYVTVFVSSEMTTDALARSASLVRQRRAVEPVFWFGLSPDVDAATDLLTDGSARLCLLQAAGVDAVLLTPGWLSLGPDRLRRLADDARLYLLSANIEDTLGQALGHPFMVRRTGDVTVGIAGIWPDTAVLLPRGVHIAGAALAARRAHALLAQRVDIIGVLTVSAGDLDVQGFDFVVGARSPEVLSIPVSEDSGVLSGSRLRIVAGIERAIPESCDLSLASPDAAVLATADSLARAAESIARAPVVTLKRDVTRADFARTLAQGALAELACDGFCCDSAFVRTGLKAGIVTNRDVVATLGQPGRLALVDMTGTRLKSLSADKSVSAELRAGLKGRQLAPGRTYRVAMTGDFLGRRLPPAEFPFDLSGPQLWTIAARALQSSGTR
jgi:2',3'-cyclic-nucleotide 2'-phosphodiesterase (5'-nucleotidase family)